jgi:O-antigen/teichoic acid export membrane protein
MLMKAPALGQWIASHPARAGTLAGWYQQGCSAIAALIAVPLVIRHLGATDSGLWFSFMGTLAVLQLTDFGLSFVMARQVAYSLRAQEGTPAGGPDFIRTREGWGGVSDVFACSVRIFRWMILAGVLALVLLYEVILPQGRLLAQAGPGTAIAWYLLGGAVLLSLQNKPYQALLDGLARTYVTRFLSGTALLISGFGALGALLLGGRLPEMAGVVALASVAHCLALRWTMKRMAGAQLTRVVRLPEGLLRQFLHVAAPMGVLNLSAFCVTSVQVPLLGSLLGAGVVPAFYLAQRIGQMLSQAVMQLVSPQLPLFTREMAAGAQVGARQRMGRTLAWVGLLSLATNAAWVAGSQVVADLWLGPGQYVSTAILAVMAVDYCLMAVGTTLAQFVLASGRNPFLWSTLANGALNLLAAPPLVLWLGVIGLPLAGLASGLCTNYWFAPLQGLRLRRRLAAVPGPQVGHVSGVAPEPSIEPVSAVHRRPTP